MLKRTNERGFIFFELAIGLPLIIMTLWAMVHLFAGTWKNCRDLIADLTLQMEIHNAMQRIVSDLRVAHKVNKENNLEIISYLYKINTGIIYKSKPYDSDPDKRPIYYFRSETTTNGKTYRAIYRQREYDAKDHPITGLDILSDVDVTYFKRDDSAQATLWDVEIRAKSRVSGHTFRLKTKVYIREPTNE